MKVVSTMTVRPTRYTELGYAHIDRGLWRIIDVTMPESPAPVGPFYRSRAELLADLPRYAREFGATEK